MVAADIFRKGRALYADHLALTEHYPISEHARFVLLYGHSSSKLISEHARFVLLYGHSSSKLSSKLRGAHYYYYTQTTTWP